MEWRYQVENELVTIVGFNDPAEAHISQAKLESEGIESYIIDENMVLHIPYATGGVKLQVKTIDRQKALKIMQQKS